MDPTQPFNTSGLHSLLTSEIRKILRAPLSSDKVSSTLSLNNTRGRGMTCQAETNTPNTILAGAVIHIDAAGGRTIVNGEPRRAAIANSLRRIHGHRTTIIRILS